MNIEEEVERSLNEILSVGSLSDARRVVAQTTVQKVELALWDTQASRRIDLLSKNEAAKRIYRKIVLFTPWPSAEDVEFTPISEAQRRNEAYLAALAFRGCELDETQLQPHPSHSFRALPYDLHLEEVSIKNTLFQVYDEDSPISDDFA